MVKTLVELSILSLVKSDIEFTEEDERIIKLIFQGFNYRVKGFLGNIHYIELYDRVVFGIASSKSDFNKSLFAMTIYVQQKNNYYITETFGFGRTEKITYKQLLEKLLTISEYTHVHTAGTRLKR